MLQGQTAKETDGCDLVRDWWISLERLVALGYNITLTPTSYGYSTYSPIELILFVTCFKYLYNSARQGDVYHGVISTGE